MALFNIFVDIAARLANFESGMQRADKVLKNFQRGVSTISRSINTTLGAIGVGFSLHALNSAIKEAIARADDFSALGQAFGTTATEISRLDYIARQSNSSIQDLAGGMQKLFVSVGGGSKQAGRVTKAFDELGLSVDSLKILPLREQLEALAGAFTKIENPVDRLTIANALFAKQAKSWVPLLNKGAEGMRQLAEESDNLGNTLTAEGTKRLEEMDRQLKKVTAASMGLKTELAIGLGPALVAIYEFFTTAAKGARVFWEALLGPTEPVAVLQEQLDDLVERRNEILNHLRRIEGSALVLPEVLVQWRGELVKVEAEMGRINLALQQFGKDAAAASGGGVGDPLVDEEKLDKARTDVLALGDPLKKLTAQFEENRQKLIAVGLEFPELRASASSAISFITAEFWDATAAVREFEDSLTSIRVDGLELTLVDSGIKEQIDHIAAALDNYSGKAIRKSVEMTAAQSQAFDRLAASIKGPTDQLALLDQALGSEAFADLDRSIKEDMTKAEGEALGKIKSDMDAMGAAFKETTDKMSVYAEQAARNMQDSLADFLFDPFDKGIKGMLSGFIDILRRMVAEAAAAKIFEALGAGRGGGFFGKLLGSILGASAGGGSGGGSGGFRFGGPKAEGGAVAPGQHYLVGEKGPELFVPGASGAIVPNNALEGSALLGGLFGAGKTGASGAIDKMADDFNKTKETFVPNNALLGGLFGAGKTGGGSGFARAAGGPVSAGKSYLVGEKGPEMFIPGASGAVVPNGGWMGGITVNNHMDNRGASVELIKALPEILNERDRRLIESLRDAKSRGQF
jgi:hypothetical protein